MPIVTVMENISRTLRGGLVNARSMCTVRNNVNKILEIDTMVNCENLDFLVVTETWLNSSILSSEVTPTNYSMERKDRDTSRGGGLAIIYKTSLNFIRRFDIEVSIVNNSEILVIELICNIDKYLFVITYRKPGRLLPEYRSDLLSVLNLCTSVPSCEICLMGDLNMPNVNWYKNTTYGDVLMGDLVNELTSFGLKQIIDCNSRQLSANILDVILTTCHTNFKDITSIPHVISSDHTTIVFNLVVEHTVKKCLNRKHYNWNMVDRHRLRLCIKNIDLINVIRMSPDINFAWTNWKTKILETIHLMVPLRRVKNIESKPWIDKEVMDLSRKKEIYRRIALKSKSDKDWDKYKLYTNNMKRLVKQKHNKFINSVCNNISSNPKMFWNYVRTKFNSRTIPKTLTFNGETSNDNRSKANMFNSFFESVFNNTVYDKPEINSYQNDNLSWLTITPDQVNKVLSKLNSSKAPGSDGIPTRFLKDYADVLSPSICELYNYSLYLGKIPNDWKMSKVIPIYKKGDKGDCQNYRPISLLPIISKVFERCVLDNIQTILYPLISPCQHGFYPGRSCITNLLYSYKDIVSNIDNRVQTDMIYLDFQKAFDSISHILLVHKLKSYGICKNLLSWFTDYLTNRKQYVCIDGIYSDTIIVSSGVPQGSILGPFLFSLFINDITNVISTGSKITLFADDAKIWSTIINQNDCVKLQYSLNNLFKWSCRWGLTFNTNKCYVMSFKNKLATNYNMNNQELLNVNEITDLGVIITSDMKWTQHVKSITGKAMKSLGIIRRCIGVKAPIQAKKSAYISLVRSKVMYNSQLWNPSSKGDIIELERVQRVSTRYICGNNDLTYFERLNVCELLPLCFTRDYADIILVYKLLYNLLNVSNDDYIKLNPSKRLTRLSQDGNLLLVPKSKGQFHRNWYLNRICKIWNSLPDFIREIPPTALGNITCFKVKLLRCQKDKFVTNFNIESVCTWRFACNCCFCTNH